MTHRFIVLGWVLLGAALSACTGMAPDEPERPATPKPTVTAAASVRPLSSGQRPSALAQARYLQREAVDRAFRDIAAAKEAALSPLEQAAIAPRLEALQAERAKLDDERVPAPSVTRADRAAAVAPALASPDKLRAYLAQVPRYDAADPRAVAELGSLKERMLAP